MHEEFTVRFISVCDDEILLLKWDIYVTWMRLTPRGDDIHNIHLPGASRGTHPMV